MKYFLVLVFIILVSTCFAWESTSVKFGAYGDYEYFGGTFGYKISHETDPEREVYIVLAGKAPFFDKKRDNHLISLFAEKHFIRANNAYGKYCMGIEYTKIEPFINFDDEEADYVVIPKLAVGAGYQFKLDEGVYLLTDFDIGIQYHIFNINIGMKF